MRDKPVLLVVAGPNGSGKTTVTQQLLEHPWTSGCYYLNPDNIAQEEFGDWNSYEATLQATQKAQAIREDCLRHKRNLLFETALSTQSKLDCIVQSKEAGFFLCGCFLFAQMTQKPISNALQNECSKVVIMYHQKKQQVVITIS